MQTEIAWHAQWPSSVEYRHAGVLPQQSLSVVQVSSAEWQKTPVNPPQYSPYEGEQTWPPSQSASMRQFAGKQELPCLALPP
jgi:hypothetical protein